MSIKERHSTRLNTGKYRLNSSSGKPPSWDSKSSKLRPPIVMPARLRLSWGMKTLKLFLLSVRESLEFGCQAIRYGLILVSAFFRQRASLGCEMVAMRSQLTFYKESIRQKGQPRPRFHPAFRLLWVLLSRLDRMEVCGPADETQNGAPVA